MNLTINKIIQISAVFSGELPPQATVYGLTLAGDLYVLDPSNPSPSWHLLAESPRPKK